MKRTRRHAAVVLSAQAGAADHGSMELHAAIEFTRDGTMRTPRFSILAYTGVPMSNVIKGQRIPIVVDLQGLEIPRASIPVLKDHNPSLIVGHTDAIQNDQRSLRVTGVASGAGQVSQEVIQSAKDGFPWQASITATVLVQEEIRRGQSVSVNGRDYVGPILVARRARLKEVSFVALGADENTSAAIAAANKEIAMNFEQWLQAKGMNINDINSATETYLRAQFKADQDLQASAGGEAGGEGEGDDAAGGTATATKPKAKAKAKPAAKKPRTPATVRASAGQASGTSNGVGGGADEDLDTELAAAAGNTDDGDPEDAPITREELQASQQAERNRIAQINRRCEDPVIRAQAIEQGWTPARAELVALRTGRPAIHTGQNRTENTGQVLEAALCRSVGLGDEFVEEQYSEQVVEASDRSDLRGIGIQGVFYAVLAAANKSVRPGNFTNDTIVAAFRADQELRASGFSTVALSDILGNVANKAMLKSFLAVESVARQFCRTRSTKDFKQTTSLRMDANGSFTKVGPDGELKTIGLKQSKYNNQVETYGAIVALNRQQIINDDLGAFMELPQHLGRLSATVLEETVFALLLANTGTFFGTGNANYQEGAGTVLSATSLTAAKKIFRQMKDSNGKLAMVTPKVLLVPSALEDTADRLYTSEFFQETTTANAPSPSRNPHKGKFRPVVAPHLDNTSMSGYSSLAWYLLADPADRAIMEIAYLNGRDTPIIESGETSFQTLGIQWRGYSDFGVAFAETQAGVKSKGEN